MVATKENIEGIITILLLICIVVSAAILLYAVKYYNDNFLTPKSLTMRRSRTNRFVDSGSSTGDSDDSRYTASSDFFGEADVQFYKDTRSQESQGSQGSDESKKSGKSTQSVNVQSQNKWKSRNKKRKPRQHKFALTSTLPSNKNIDKRSHNIKKIHDQTDHSSSSQEDEKKTTIQKTVL